jgi:GT2 family glycosyltransferase
MTNNKPTISVIIPTYNPRASLQRTLDALGAQTYPLQQLEVLAMVAHNCTDGTIELLQCYQAPFNLRIIQQLGQETTAMLSHVTAAQGRLFLFLDDDIEVTPALVEAHVRAHQGQSGQVVIGLCSSVFQKQNDLLRIMLRAWWVEQFSAMHQPSHRYNYRDLFGSNFSMEASLFSRIGGFDTQLRYRQKHELGFRLLKAGVSFVFAADALAYHHETADLNCWFRRVRQEGREDVLMGRRHPELRATLSLANREASSWRASRILRYLAFTWPAIGDRFATGLQHASKLLEQARLRDRWLWLYRSLHAYWYWRGVTEELSTWRALIVFLQGSSTCVDHDGLEIELDLRQGLEMAEKRLDTERPASVRIRYGQRPVGRIPPQPGAERLRGAHLRSLLVNDLAEPLLRVVALERAMNGSVQIDQLPTLSTVQLPGDDFAR